MSAQVVDVEASELVQQTQIIQVQIVGVTQVVLGPIVEVLTNRERRPAMSLPVAPPRPPRPLAAPPGTTEPFQG
jgi:hypothetical protein